MKQLLQLPALCPFGGTTDEHFAYEARDGSCFRIWALVPSKAWFLRVFAEPGGDVSYLIANSNDIAAEIAPLLPLLRGRGRRRSLRLLRRWGLRVEPSRDFPGCG